MTLAGMQRDRQVGHWHVVEVAPTQIIDIVAHGGEFEAQEALAGAEVAQMQQKVDLGADRAALFGRLVLRYRQREEEIPIALG
jgi:hypothetical protein